METIKELIIKRLREELTPAEEQQLQSWVARSLHNRAVFEEVNDPNRLAESFTKLDNLRTEETWERIKNYSEEDAIATITPMHSQEDIPTTVTPVHRVHFLKTAWFKYAAAVLLLITGIATYYFIHTSQSQTEMVLTTPSPKPNEDVLPGSDRAILTLSNGQQVQLNNAASETIKDGALSIKNINGQLSYSGSLSPAGGSGREAAEGGLPGGQTATNTMATPKGGQYKLTLSDGTKVWLNAASSITYPTAFANMTREVAVTGEAYFEVAKNKEKPFIVSFNNSTIEVLGTSFNVNAYEDEQVSKTTLVSGSVRVNHASQRVILAPNEEATIGNTLSVNKNANVKQALAWKNGVFNFKGQSFAAGMRQIERWYDVKVVYTDGIPQQKLWGSTYRNLTLEQLLKGLEGADARFRLEGRILHVMP